VREERLDHIGQRRVDAQQRERLVEPDPDLHRLAERGENSPHVLARRARRLDAEGAEQSRRFADPVALVDPVAQPFDAHDVALGVAPLSACGAVGLQDPVALLPLPQRVGRHAGSLRKRSNVESPGHRFTGPCPDYAPDMPEGDALHRAARRLQVLAGQKVEVETPHPRAATKQLAEQLDGRRLESVEAVGKNLLLRFEGGLVLRSHLRMNGRWRVEPRGAHRTGRPWLVLRGDEHEAVLWNGPVLELARDARVRHLGPDILASPPDFDAMLELLRAEPKSRAVGDALLDQRLVAGIGNMWKAEALWDARVSPWRTLGDVDDDELLATLRAASRLMRRRLDGARPLHHVYRRAGRGCHRCGGVIRSHPQGEAARTAYWCPGCQVGGRPPKA
jgi:endonuclease VIII